MIEREFVMKYWTRFMLGPFALIGEHIEHSELTIFYHRNEPSKTEAVVLNLAYPDIRWRCNTL